MPRITEPLDIDLTASHKFIRAYRPRTIVITRFLYVIIVLLPLIISICFYYLTDTNMILLFFVLQFLSVYPLQEVANYRKEVDKKWEEIDKNLRERRKENQRAMEIKMAAEKSRERYAQGNKVTAGNGAIVIISSEVASSFNNINKDDPQLADAITTISGEVERSGNKEAGKAWARFIKELTGDRDDSVLSSLWDKVVKLVPDVEKLVESVAKITSLFA